MQSASPVHFIAASQSDPTARDLMKEMASHLRAMLGMEGLDDFRNSRRLPAAFFQRYRLALVAYDHYIDHIIDAEGFAVSCRAGCSACCRHELARGVTAVEILAIYELVRPWADIGALYESAGENAVAFQRLLRAELAADARPLGADDARVQTAHFAYNRLQRPCPFLDLGAGICRIYPVRPLVCRWFYNLSPAEWCGPEHPRYQRRDAIGVDPYREINGLLAHICRRLDIETLNYLSGAFVHVAGDVLSGRPIDAHGLAGGDAAEPGQG